MILVYTESENGKLKKSAFELVSYAKALSQSTNNQVIALTINTEDVSILSNYGADKIITIQDEQLKDFTAKAHAELILQIALKENIKTIIVSNSTNARYIAPMVAVAWDSDYLSNVASLPENGSFKKILFSSKAIGMISSSSERKIISLSGNAFGLKENPTQSEIVSFTPEFSDKAFAIKTIENKKTNNKISLSEASIVVSGGRGLKSPDNWHLIEDLAEVLGAATACTKPVSDMNWRPHSEHVGQTGKPVACDLYIAIGISGAIQHLAGINSSKTKVVINSDAEAPFFKAADYGIVGDAFEIVPKLIEKIKALK